jgi:hypothetical protein
MVLDRESNALTHGESRVRQTQETLAIAWFLVLTAINALNWRIVPCEWSRPYR